MVFFKRRAILKKLSEYKGEEALELLAELIEPAMEIMTDADVVKNSRAGAMPKAIAAALRNHKQAVLNFMAAIERKDPKEYAEEVNLLTLPKQLLEILNDPEAVALFTSQGQTETASSGSASENTEGRKK